MNLEDIKPIPKYMLKMLEKQDKKDCPQPNRHLRFLGYLAIWKGELVKVTVAIKHNKKQWYCKQVAIHGIDSELCLVKDLEYCGYVGYGYRVGWYTEGLSKYPTWYESTDWCSAKDKYYDPPCNIVNMEIIDKLPEFKYSQYKLFNGCNIIKYLRYYKAYPEIEYFMKQGLQQFIFSKTILNKAKKDKQFCKWLLKNKAEFSTNYYVNAILRAYKNKTNLYHEQLREKLKIQNKQGLFYTFKQNYIYDFNELIEYVIKQNTSMQNYIDYFNACTYLGLDLGHEKNRFPHNFMRWHDIRIDEYRTQKAIQDKKLKEELYEQFKQVASKYEKLQYNKKTDFVVLIAKTPQDLIYEGEQLNHCVGSMNYDQKFIREETLIFFIRNKQETDKPLVTLEYSIEKHNILQCYAEHDSKPSPDIENYVNNIWLPYANRQIKKIQLTA